MHQAALDSKVSLHCLLLLFDILQLPLQLSHTGVHLQPFLSLFLLKLLHLLSHLFLCLRQLGTNLGQLFCEFLLPSLRVLGSQLQRFTGGVLKLQGLFRILQRRTKLIQSGVLSGRGFGSIRQLRPVT